MDITEEIKTTEVLTDPLAVVKKPTQAELAKQYIYYSCTPLKYKVADSVTPSDSQVEQNDNNQPTISGALDADELLSICQDKKVKNLTSVASNAAKKKLVDRTRTRQKDKSKGYEFGVIYRKVSGKMGVRKFKILRGNAPDKFNSSALYEEMRNKFAKLLLSHKDFCQDTFERCGGIFNKKFWEINIAWGEDDSLQGNLTTADLLLCNKLSL